MAISVPNINVAGVAYTTKPDPVGSFLSGAGGGLSLRDMIESAARKKVTQAREDFLWDFKLKTELSDQAADLYNKTQQLTYDTAKLDYEAEKTSYDILGKLLTNGGLDPGNVDGSDLYRRYAPGAEAGRLVSKIDERRSAATNKLLGDQTSDMPNALLPPPDEPVVPYDDRASFNENFMEDPLPTP